nr:immunoglobulin heavy chain junction region [Mus musculus]MBK4196009.1 immunoglobulin heavy chain junction region [Mus musculus]MBK4196010.1 immunoglobulin heavy chain junction region [Mus musculus]
CARGGYDYDYW